ncbi:porin [Catenovulum maritimum]|uniref:Alginate export domain-containing protein n=1 Tax=Catenovulum maritimum TaxID=1513271 RepID=A0A0J8GSM6_9ALTE|nr:alginate export family protein [Catenovulum maritimum]KMT64294.1 hypothetical protein XM47_14945 [Catenovulum maritimum]
MELKKSKLAITLASVISTVAVSAPTYAADTIADAFTEGKASAAFRLRYEGVENPGKAKYAKAGTLKSSLSYKTAEFSGFTAFVQLDNNTAFIDDYALTTSDPTYHIVADDEYTEINEANIKYAADGYAITYGRQTITNLNQRFIGHVGWRQNKQTFDGLRAQATFGDVSVDYSYITNVNTIRDKNDDVDAHNFLATYKLSETQSVSGFFYNYELAGAADALDTYGIDYSGKFSGVALHASYATQSQGSFDADYLALDAKYKVGSVTFGAGYELLGSDGGNGGFTTPLATKHAFNGWADLFLGTPDNGLEDTFASVAYKQGKFKAMAVYHSYSEDHGGADAGSEVDIVVGYSISKNYSLTLKYADFSGDVARPLNVTKSWIEFNAKF